MPAIPTDRALLAALARSSKALQEAERELELAEAIAERDDGASLARRIEEATRGLYALHHRVRVLGREAEQHRDRILSRAAEERRAREAQPERSALPLRAALELQRAIDRFTNKDTRRGRLDLLRRKPE